MWSVEESDDGAAGVAQCQYVRAVLVTLQDCQHNIKHLTLARLGLGSGDNGQRRDSLELLPVGVEVCREVSRS